MKKSLISTILLFSIVISTFMPAYAVSYQENDSQDTLLQTYQFDRRIYKEYYRPNVGIVIRREFDDNVIEKIGNEVYLNGELAVSITIKETTSEFEAEPKTGWSRQENCPYDWLTEDDFNIYVKTNVVDLKLQDSVINLSTSVLMELVSLALGLFSGIAAQITSSIIGYVKDNMQWQDSKYIYCEETYYRTDKVPFTQKIDCRYFMGKENGKLVGEVKDAATTIYATWG